MFESIFLSYLFVGVVSLCLYKQKIISFYFGLIANAIISAFGAIWFVLNLNEPKSIDLAGFLFEPNLLLTPLGAFFSFIVCFICSMSAIYSLGYLKNYEINFAIKSSLLSFFTLSMLLVINSNDVFGFVVFWELMTLISALMVKFNDTPSSNYSVMLYLGVAQIGAFCIIVALLVLANLSGSLYFSDWSFSEQTHIIICVLILIGFGSKAGIVPFHVWSPLIYPLANSNISAIFSSAMSKVAIFALIKFMLVLNFPAYFALAMMIIGVFGAVWAISLACLQNEYKKIIAYSSAENMGIILLALGAWAYGNAIGNTLISTLGLVGAVLHSLNHSVFKAILFFVAGNIFVASKKLKINSIGGLAKFMPITAICALIAICSIIAVPFFNGFVSEWVIYKALLNKLDFVSAKFIFAFGVIGLSVAGVLCAIGFMKFYGLIFSGTPKSNYKEAPLISLIPMIILSICCVILAIFSPNLIKQICEFLEYSLPNNMISFSLLWFALAGALILPFAIIALFGANLNKPRLTKTWANGYKFQDDFLPNSNSVVGDLKRLLAKFMLIKFKNKKSYVICVKDAFMEILYIPVINLCLRVANKFAILQNGKFVFYVIYMIVYLGILAIGIFYFLGNKS